MYRETYRVPSRGGRIQTNLIYPSSPFMRAASDPASPASRAEWSGMRRNSPSPSRPPSGYSNAREAASVFQPHPDQQRARPWGGRGAGWRAEEEEEALT